MNDLQSLLAEAKFSQRGNEELSQGGSEGLISSVLGEDLCLADDSEVVSSNPFTTLNSRSDLKWTSVNASETKTDRKITQRLAKLEAGAAELRMCVETQANTIDLLSTGFLAYCALNLLFPAARWQVLHLCIGAALVFMYYKSKHEEKSENVPGGPLDMASKSALRGSPRAAMRKPVNAKQQPQGDASAKSNTDDPATSSSIATAPRSAIGRKRKPKAAPGTSMAAKPGGGTPSVGASRGGRAPSGDLKEVLAAVPQMRKRLSRHYPESRKLYTDAYLTSVMMMSDSQDPTKRRSFETCAGKLLAALAARRAYNPDGLNVSTDAPLRKALSCGSLYFHGFDKLRRPILWVRSARKDWPNLDEKAEIRMCTLITETGIRLMPRGVTQFVVVVDASNISIRQMRIGLFKEQFRILKKVYVDRLAKVFVGPVGMVVTGIWKLLRPFMPKRLPGKLCLMKKPYRELQSVLRASQIPAFFQGGTSTAHEALFPGGVFEYAKMCQEQKALLAKTEAKFEV